MLPSLQQQLPHQFANNVQSGGVDTLTWPDEYDAILTDLTVLSGGGGGSPVVIAESGAGVAYCSAGGVEVATSGLYVGAWHGFQVVPAGSVIKMAVAGTSVQYSLSGWLLIPGGAGLLPT